MAYIPEQEKKSLWWRDGVIYQIYPRSFADSNGDGIGDLKGVISKLDYLVQLGISAIWLSPITPSPDFDFGYDCSDYKNIDPKFGTLDDYRQLIAEAHRRDIRIVMDLVLNHSSTQHSWFVEAQKSKDNPYHDYYLWRDEPNNWLSCFTQKNGWKYIESCGQYYFHLFCPEQADLNWRNSKIYQEMMDIFRFWADLGTDGFRLDVFNAWFKDEQFRNNPRGRFALEPFNRFAHPYDFDQPEMISAVQEIRQILNSYPDRYVVGETFYATHEKLQRYCGEDKLHGAFHFDFTHCRWDATRFRKIIQEMENTAGNSFFPNYCFNNHDVRRSASRFGLGEHDERLKVAAALLLTLRGTPFLYYGEEIGMRELKLKRSELMDPVGINFWPVRSGRDGCRAPMQWNNGVNGGFTSGKPWIKIHPDYAERNVNAQIHDPQSLWTFYRDLIALRKQHRVLQIGELQWVDEKNEFVLAYTRAEGARVALIALNFSQLPAKLQWDDALQSKKWTKKISNKPNSTPMVKDGKLMLAGEQAIIWFGN